MFDFVKRHKIACGLIVLDVIIVLVVILAVVYNDAKTAKVDIHVAPSQAVIELNGQKFDNFVTRDLLPGDYHVKVSMDGMQTKEFDLSLEDGEFRKIQAYLVDANGGFDFYINNPDEEMILAEVANDVPSKEFVEKYNHVLNLVNELPLEYYDRSDPNNPIGVFVEQTDKDCEGHILCLVAYGGEQNRDIVNNLIRETGHEPSEYKIVYSDGSEAWNE